VRYSLALSGRRLGVVGIGDSAMVATAPLGSACEGRTMRENRTLGSAKLDAAEQGDEADEAFGGMVARMDMPPHARAGRVGRGHRFAAYPRVRRTSAECHRTSTAERVAHLGKSEARR
jgi:hypothetical protein